MKKYRIRFYKQQVLGITFKPMVPNVSFSKNAQGWFYTRYWSISWFAYCLQYSITITSDLKVDRKEAHKLNVQKYWR